MCFILLSKRTDLTKAEPRVENLIKAHLQHQMMNNYDGFFIKDAKNGEIRTADFKLAVDHLDQSPIDSLMAHCRLATTGSKGDANIHGWSRKGWTFLHNGVVQEYTGYNQIKTDSLLFFERLLSKIKKLKNDDDIADAIADCCNYTGFWGRAVLYHKKSDKIFLFGDFDTYLINNNYLIVSSTGLDFNNYTEHTSVNGFGFKSIVATNFKVIHKKIDGVARILNFSHNNFKYEWLRDMAEADDEVQYIPHEINEGSNKGKSAQQILNEDYYGRNPRYNDLY